MKTFRALLSRELPPPAVRAWAVEFEHPRHQANLAVWSEQGIDPREVSLAEPGISLGHAVANSAARLQERQTSPSLFRLCLGAWGGLGWYKALYEQTTGTEFPAEKVTLRKRDELSTRLWNIAQQSGELAVALESLCRRDLVLALQGESNSVGRAYFEALGPVGRRSFVEFWKEGRELSELQLAGARDRLNCRLDLLIDRGELYARDPADYKAEWDFRDLGNTTIAFRELLLVLPRAKEKGLTFSLEPEPLGFLLRLVPEGIPAVRSLYSANVWRKLYEPRVLDSRDRPWMVCKKQLHKAEQSLTAIWYEDRNFYSELEQVALRVLWEAFSSVTED